jgi:hypothetical protein
MAVGLPALPVWYREGSRTGPLQLLERVVQQVMSREGFTWHSVFGRDCPGL